MPELMKSAYTYLFPEVRQFLNFDVDPALYLNINKVDWDFAHEPVIDKIVKAFAGYANLGIFDYRYQTSGSSEGIFHAIAQADEINVWGGEYEGYAEYAKALKKPLHVHQTYSIPKSSGVWFISNPSAIDGNYLPDGLIDEMLNDGHKIWLDMAYMSLAPKKYIDLSHENLLGVFTSFSKPYGIFRDRFGVTYSHEPIPSLYGNKWFKNTRSLLLAEKLVDNIPPGVLYDRYAHVQKHIVNDLLDVPNVQPSDVLVLAHSVDCEYHDFRRVGNTHRFCITQFFEAKE